MDHYYIGRHAGLNISILSNDFPLVPYGLRRSTPDDGNSRYQNGRACPPDGNLPCLFQALILKSSFVLWSCRFRLLQCHTCMAHISTVLKVLFSPHICGDTVTPNMCSSFAIHVWRVLFSSFHSCRFQEGVYAAWIFLCCRYGRPWAAGVPEYMRGSRR